MVRRRSRTQLQKHRKIKLREDQYWRLCNLGQLTEPTFGDSGWINGSVVSSSSHHQLGPVVHHRSFAVETPARDESRGSAPQAMCAGRTSVSCLELRDLNSQDYAFLLPLSQNHVQPRTHEPNHNQLYPHHHQLRKQRLSNAVECKSKNLSKYHAASLAKAARQIHSRDSDKPLPKKARWLIIVIGIILFGMSMLLVGVTLRLAPMIDEIVRKEHEDLLRRMNQSIIGYHRHSSNAADVNNSSGNGSRGGGSGNGNDSGLPEETEMYHSDEFSTEPSWPPEE